MFQNILLSEIAANIAPGYELIIPVNIHLNLMKKRAECCYYRNPQSFLSDTRTLYLNAVHYNNDDSPIALRVRAFVRVCDCAHVREFVFC